MLPFQQIDLSKLSYGAVLDILAPTLPGGVIALGWLWSHNALLASVREERALNVVIAGFVIYLTGIVANYLTSMELVGVSVIVLIKRAKVYDPPWVNTEWRKLASKFLGPDFSPPLEDTAEPKTEEPTHPSNFEKISWAIKENFRRAMAPVQFRSRWQTWYEIMAAYFPISKSPQQSFADFYFATLNSIGWCVLIAAFVAPQHGHWTIWVIGTLTIALSHFAFAVNFEQQRNSDPSGNQLAAEMLKAIKNRDERSS
jgi:hypothetical protein